MATQTNADRKLVRTLILGAALFMGSIAGVGSATAGALNTCGDAGGSSADAAWKMTASERSIAMIESKEAPGGVRAGGGDVTHQAPMPTRPNQAAC